jgi:hypothetical protein
MAQSPMLSMAQKMILYGRIRQTTNEETTISEDDREIYYNDEDEDDNIPLSALRDIYRIFQEENQEGFDGF